MEFTPLNIMNQIIAWFAITILETVFVIGDASARKSVILRYVLGNVAGLAFVMTYFPFYKLAKMVSTEQTEAVLIYIWWGGLYFLTITIVFWWYKLTIGQALFRCTMGVCLYAIGNTVIQNFILGLWFTNIAEESILIYVAVNGICYALLGLAGYFLIARHMQFMSNLGGLDTRMMYGFLSLLLIFSNIVWSISNGIFKHALESIKKVGEYAYAVASVQYFCGITSIVFSIFVLCVLFLFYRISFLRQEEEMLKYLQNEKEKQYEYSKQNMDVINQKCHDLKRQIQALRFSKDTEREQLYQETEKAADYFDYVIKTENSLLNTILTEKGLLCHNRRIRLTCTVNNCEFDRISVIDLYTILSNAIDNAIECVEHYDQEEKKIISVNITQTGGMNYIMIENYFDGGLIFQNGQLMTSKEDTDYHGFGVRSIQMLVKRYKGAVRVSHTNHIFSIQIMLPV